MAAIGKAGAVSREGDQWQLGADSVDLVRAGFAARQMATRGSGQFSEAVGQRLLRAAISFKTDRRNGHCLGHWKSKRSMRFAVKETLLRPDHPESGIG